MTAKKIFCGQSAKSAYGAGKRRFFRKPNAGSTCTLLNGTGLSSATAPDRALRFARQCGKSFLQIPYGQNHHLWRNCDSLQSSRAAFHMSAQAVGGAVGHNGISILIPCHRVVGTNGSLTGYAGASAREINCWNWRKRICATFSFQRRNCAFKERSEGLRRDCP